MANVEKFKYWCNKILPLVYDDSLSYYEFLGKVYEKLNETIDAVNDNTAAIAEFDQRINDFIAAETAAREGWEDQQERDRQSWETTETANRAAWENQQALKWSAFQAMFISEYDPDNAYVRGDLCSVQYKMYVANASTTGAFDPSKWDEIVLSEYLTDYVQTAASSLQTQYNDFLTNYQRQFGVVDNLDSSPTDASSAAAVYSTVGKNLLDTTDPDFMIGGFYDGANEWNSNANYCESGFIPCRAGQKIFRVKANGTTGFNSTAITYYDGDKEYITAGLYTGTSATVPNNSNIRFFRIPVAAPIAANNYKIDALYFSDESTLQPPTLNSSLYREIECGNFMGLLFDQTNGNLIDESDTRNKDGYYWTTDWVADVRYKSYYIPLKFGKMLFCYYNGEQKFPATTIPVFDADNNYLYSFSFNDATKMKIIGKTVGTVALPDHCFVTFNKTTTTESVIWYEPITAARKRYTLKTAKNEITRIQQILETLEPEASHWIGKSWYAYGTSITSIAQGKYVPYLEAFSGLIATNKGIPGGGIGNLGAFSTGQVYSAICNTTDGKLSADLITLETGANDVNANVPLGTIYDTGTSTLAGCLNDCIRYLQTNTTAQIVIIESPTANTPAPQEANQSWKWRLMMRDICMINCVTFIPIESNVGYAKMVSSQGSDYLVDNIHQTELGGYVYAEAIYKYLKNVPTFKTSLPE